MKYNNLLINLTANFFNKILKDYFSNGNGQATVQSETNSRNKALQKWLTGNWNNTNSNYILVVIVVLSSVILNNYCYKDERKNAGLDNCTLKQVVLFVIIGLIFNINNRVIPCSVTGTVSNYGDNSQSTTRLYTQSQ